MTGALDVAASRLTSTGSEAIVRSLPVEAPIAIEFNGIGYAVMMATPLDLEDFITGFALSEQLIASPASISGIEAVETDRGWLLKAQLDAEVSAAFYDRIRHRVSEGSCGLCGLENLDQVWRALPRALEAPRIDKQAIFRALSTLPAFQPLNAKTGGLHAAAYCDRSGAVLFVREDVGRHSALDKLVGAMARSRQDAVAGFILLTSRCSSELVEKAAIAGCGTLVTISVATSLALLRARESGLRLIALARQDALLDMTPK